MPDYSAVMADPGNEPVTEETFFDATDQLRTIHQWARARYAAPWAVFGAVLARVAASTEPSVQLPGLIGGRASLNLLCAFVSASGGGKGVSDKVSRLAWPAPITELPIGSGEGIAEAFRPPAKIDEDNEPLTRAIFNVPEIDTLAGLATRQGSILLATMKSVAMGEQIGQTNATKALSRRVDAHTYRACWTVGVQYGHGGVIFSDTTGGTPQRFLWFGTTDPDMPDEAGADPGPLNTAQPAWEWTVTGTGGPPVAEIIYGVPEIRETVVGAHLARQRGQGDALDGHALLTRLKVAAALAIMHHRQTVNALDWELSEIVMAVSDRTRHQLLDHARQAERAKVRERAIGRAVFDEIIDDRHATTVRNRVTRLLAAGSMPRGELRRGMGKQHYRESFDAVFPYLLKVGTVVEIPGEKAPHYALSAEFTGEPEFTPGNCRSDGVNHEFTGELAATVTDLETRRSHDSDCPDCRQHHARPDTGRCDSCTLAKVGAHEFLVCWLRANTSPGEWIAPAVVLAAGDAIGYKHSTLKAAQQRQGKPRVESSGAGRGSRWRLDPANFHTGEATA